MTIEYARGNLIVIFVTIASGAKLGNNCPFSLAALQRRLGERSASVRIHSDDSLTASEAEAGRGVETVGGESCVWS